MDEQALLNAKDEDYMNNAQLTFFDDRLQQLKRDTLREIESLKSEIALSRVSDVNDRATLEEEAAIAIRIADRKRKLLPKIDAARLRIRQGDYGFCLQSGEPIGIARLLIRPTAEYCADVKTINEKRETHYGF